MAEARRPTRREIAAVAARIWCDWMGKSVAAWDNIRPGSAVHRRIRAAARLALGVLPKRQTVADERAPKAGAWWLQNDGQEEALERCWE